MCPLLYSHLFLVICSWKMYVNKWELNQMLVKVVGSAPLASVGMNWVALSYS